MEKGQIKKGVKLQDIKSIFTITTNLLFLDSAQHDFASLEKNNGKKQVNNSKCKKSK